LTRLLLFPSLLLILLSPRASAALSAAEHPPAAAANPSKNPCTVNSEACEAKGQGLAAPEDTGNDSSAGNRGGEPRFDVTRFGAVGDARTDDTAAIQAAFDACWGNGKGVQPYGGTVVFPGNHTYNVSRTINIYDSCRMEGIGTASPNFGGAQQPVRVSYTGPTYGAVSRMTGFTVFRNQSSIIFKGNPRAGDTVTVNGVAIEFVSGGAQGDQVNIGSSAQETAAALAAMLNGSNEPGLKSGRPYGNPGAGVVEFRYQSAGLLTGQPETIATNDPESIEVAPALFPRSSPGGGRAPAYEWLATVQAENQFAAGDWVFLQGLSSANGVRLNNVVSQVIAATGSSFTIFLPQFAPPVGRYNDGGTATSLSVVFATDSYARYQQEVKDIAVVRGGVQFYFGSRVDSGSRVLGIWSQSAGDFGFYFLNGGIDYEFDKSWRCDSPGIACVYWRVEGGGNLGMGNATVSSKSGASLELDNSGCFQGGQVRVHMHNMSFEVEDKGLLPGMGEIVALDCPSDVFPVQFQIDMEGVSVAGDRGAVNDPTIVMSPPNDAALLLSISNGILASATGASGRWVGIPSLVRQDQSEALGFIPRLTYAPAFKSIGSMTRNDNLSAAMASQCLGDCDIGQLWQYGVQASAVLYTDAAFAALPNGTTLFAGQIVAPPSDWKSADGNRYAIRVVSHAGTTGIPNSGATTCIGDKHAWALVCTSANDLSVGQHISAGPVSNAFITRIDASDPKAVRVGVNRSVGTVTSATPLTFSAPVLGPEIRLGAQGGQSPRTAHAYCTGTAAPSSTLVLFGAGSSQPSCTSPVGTESGAQLLMNSSGRVSNLAVRCGQSGVSAESGVFSIWDLHSGTAMAGASSGEDTGVSVTYGTTKANTTVFDPTHSFAYAKGDLLRVQFKTQAGETLADCAASFDY
jgi:hypothetical protein